MYGKIFDTIYDGTLRASWQALITFQQFIVLADADGIVDLTAYAISGRTGIPQEIIDEGIKILEEIDPQSRTPDEDGRRIVRIDEHRSWGWHIVNHEKYKSLQDSDTKREQTRERVRKFREKRQNQDQSGNDEKRTVTHSNGQKRHTDTDTDTDTELDLDHSISPPCTPPKFECFWTAYPRKVAKAAALKAWEKLKPNPVLLKTILEALEKQKRQPKWQEAGGEFIPHAATWLNQRRWEDEIAVVVQLPVSNRPSDDRRWRDVQ